MFVSGVASSFDWRGLMVHSNYAAATASMWR